jgi:hypothetical protein
MRRLQRLDGGDKPIPALMDRLDVARLLRIIVQSPANLTNTDRQHTLSHCGLSPPHIEQQVAQAIRDIETLKEEVEVTRAGTALARTQLEAEQEKFRLGLTTSFNVLELQEDLFIARTDETRVLSDYNVALARLDQLTGKLQYDATASTTK